MTRWQKPYAHVPADDYLSSKQYLSMVGMRISEATRLNTGIGPHERRYINLMRLGLKPVANIDPCELQFWEEDIRKHGWIVREQRILFEGCSEVFLSYYIGLPGQEWRINKLISIFKRLEKRPPNDLEEAQIGFLFGYTKECIAYYLKRLRKLLHYREEGVESVVPGFDLPLNELDSLEKYQ
jgi:hypothetical protein